MYRQVLIVVSMLLFTVLSLTVINSHADRGEHSIYGAGAISCGKALEQTARWNQQNSSELGYQPMDSSFLQWALGWISRADFYFSNSTDLRLKKSDSAAIGRVLRNYCERYPLEDFAQAVFFLELRLLPK